MITLVMFVWYYQCTTNCRLGFSFAGIKIVQKLGKSYKKFTLTVLSPAIFSVIFDTSERLAQKHLTAH